MQTLLIHIRPDKATRDHEFSCFLKHSGLKPDQVDRVNVFERLPSSIDLTGKDALIVGGSGDYCVSQNDVPRELAATTTLLQAAREKHMPMLAVCFGAQVMAQAFGGKVELDEERMEMGTFEVRKHPEAQECSVFSKMPEAFHAQLGHKDHITKLPPGAIRVASSDLCDVQAFTFPGEPIHAFTFHPELDQEAINWRIDYYAQNYGLTPKKLAEMKAGIGPTPEAVKTLEHFFDSVVASHMAKKIPLSVSV